MKRLLMTIFFVGMMLFAVHALTAGTRLEAQASIAGTVTWTVQSGSAVPVGGELVRVRTLTGEVAAARAEDGCLVREVLVAVGDDIKAGEVVARVEKQDL